VNDPRNDNVKRHLLSKAAPDAVPEEYRREPRMLAAPSGATGNGLPAYPTTPGDYLLHVNIAEDGTPTLDWLGGTKECPTPA
jgi:hypothetical protein